MTQKELGMSHGLEIFFKMAIDSGTIFESLAGYFDKKDTSIIAFEKDSVSQDRRAVLVSK